MGYTPPTVSIPDHSDVPSSDTVATRATGTDTDTDTNE